MIWTIAKHLLFSIIIIMLLLLVVTYIFPVDPEPVNIWNWDKLTRVTR